ncbi:DUF4153 domain-containing protein [Pedobacter zeae]|uniref:DUF4153 domain-containing protein n=1 Tax=Pedobacter zeae TaxID=1737356 RepID=A0A7W6KDD7_9SPHI|nr:DUF4153 domain-containing protein [Pedobacter zeae]MBB4109743.1 hypothetical protein [Pedobacter zeae]GGH13984.1 hypothetical protein GCM10007422_34980 [Pedobacter zeae]
MKLPSLQQLYSGFINVIKRFPLQFIFAVAATICSCYYIQISDYRYHSEQNEILEGHLLKAIAILNLALTLVLALDLISERNQYQPAKKWLLRLGGILMSAILYFSLDPVNYSADLYRIFLFAFAFHLLVAFAPFIGHEKMNGFWQFNKTLFLRFLTSALYSAVLYAGLAIALVAINGLFNADIRWPTYMTLFAIITAGFSTTFFLAGIPTDYKLLEQDQSYPKGLKIFAQFVLIPLVTIYLAILLIYELKIAVQWQLPKGLVSSLILGYSVFGILSLLLVYPVKDTEGNNWIRLFSRFFYIMLIPLVVLLLLAVWKRVGHYGITESRYILTALALWLTGITIYFLFSKKQNIKVIPISLCIISLLATYGPQSAFSVSKFSQLSRLKTIMKSREKEDVKERPAVIRYLVYTHGLKTLQPFTKKDLGKIEEKIDNSNNYRYTMRMNKVDTALAIFKVKGDKTYDPGVNITLQNDENQVLNVKGYDYLIELDGYPGEKVTRLYGTDLTTSNTNTQISLLVNHQSALLIELKAVFDQAVKAYKKGTLKSTGKKQEFLYPAKLMSVSKNINGYQYTIVITSLESTYYEGNEDDYFWNNSRSYLLIRKL